MKEILKKYLEARPLFLSLIRAKEIFLWQKYLPLKKPALDLGCGDGFFAKMAFGRLDIGLDITNSRINEVEKETYKKLVTYDGKKMPSQSNSVNTVVSNCVLEHIPNLEGIVREIYRVLKPGGLFLTTVMAKPWEDNLMFGGWYKDWMRKRQVHLNLLKFDDWVKRFEMAGFKVEENIGYLSPAACRLLDVCHYLSLPSLVSYKFTGRWTWGWKWYPVNWLSKIMSENVEAKDSGAIFFVLKK